MRILHTADWHLGHTLGDYDRSAEHAAFLDWLLDRIDEHQVDALLVAGDIFETANPPVRAERAWYEFLATARRRFPALDLVAVGGNHDSAPRLDAPRPVLRSVDVRVVGGLPHRSGKQIDLDRALVPLHDRSGAVAAWVVAVPYLRAADLPSVAAGDPVRGGVQAVYDSLAEAARGRQEPGQALLCMGHLHAQGASESPDSERKVLGRALLAERLFGDRFAYTALGHLHKAQELLPGVHYSGSPIPLSMTERHYQHQVLLVELEGEALRAVTPLEVPRTVDLVRVPDEGALPLAEVLEALAELPDKGLVTPSLPFLEVRVALDEPQPALRHRIEKALDGKAVRLLRVKTSLTGSGETLQDAEQLQDLDVEDVFLRLWARDHADPPPEEVLQAFRSLLDEGDLEETA